MRDPPPPPPLGQRMFASPSIVSPLTKLRMCFVMMNVHWVEEQALKSVTLGVETLAKMGCHIPLGKGKVLFKTIIGLMAAKKYTKTLTPEFVANLPLATDPGHSGVMQMLESLVYPCHMAKPEIIPLLVSK